MVNFKVRILPGCEEIVRFFLTDIDERIFDTILVQVKYVYWLFIIIYYSHHSIKLIILFLYIKRW